MSHISYIQYKTIKEMEDYKQTLYNDELLNILRFFVKFGGKFFSAHLANSVSAYIFL